MAMMSHLRRVFGWGTVLPPTMDQVAAAKLAPEEADRSRQATSDLVSSIMAAQRKSVEVRRELASSVIDIVAGD